MTPTRSWIASGRHRASAGRALHEFGCGGGQLTVPLIEYRLTGDQQRSGSRSAFSAAI